MLQEVYHTAPDKPLRSVVFAPAYKDRIMHCRGVRRGTARMDSLKENETLDQTLNPKTLKPKTP